MLLILSLGSSEVSARRLLAALLCTAAVIGDVVCYVPDEIDSDTFELVD